jgi:uncharacterized membrane protein YkvA (DUF1232 family)
MPPLQDVMGPAAHHAQPTHGPVAVDVVKAIPMVGGAYLIGPIDILPDVFPVLGQLDDIGVVMASIALFLRLCPDTLVRVPSRRHGGRPEVLAGARPGARH